MRIFVKIIFLSFALIPAWLPLDASSIIKIQGINAAAEFPKIDIDVTVHGGNKNPLQDLDESNFLIYEDGYRVNYVKISAITNTLEQQRIVLCIDSSKSISSALLKEIKASAIKLLSMSNPLSPQEIALYRFNDEVILLNNFTNNTQTLGDSISKIERHGTKTLLYNAIYDAIQLLDDTSSENKAVLVFTDGMDEGSSVTVKDVLAFSKETATPIFFIGFNASSKNSQIARIAKLSGGKIAYSKQKANIEKIYADILSSMQNEYTISYHSLLKPDGKNHQLEVRLNYKDLRGRDSSEFCLQKTSFVQRLLTNRDILTFAAFAAIALLLIIILTLLLKKKNLHKKLPRAKTAPHDSPYEEPEIISVALTEPAWQEYAEEEKDEIDQQNNPHYSNAWLIQKDGADSGKKIILRKDETTIGKKEDNNIIIHDNAASSKHAKIKNVCGVFYLFDMISSNGTFLNGSKLLRPKPLYDWDEINIGNSCFIFRGSKIIG